MKPTYSEMDLAKIEVNTFGGAPIAEHNMPCPICWKEKAVLFLNTGTFYPCRKCASHGWVLLRLPRWLARHQTPAMQAVYLQLYAESWGRGRPTVRISQKDIAERIGVAARRTVQVAIEKLVYKDHIRLVDNPAFRPHSQDAKEYQVRSAEDVLGPPSPV